MAAFTETIEIGLPELFKIIGTNVDVTSATSALDQSVAMIETISGVIFDGEDRDMPIRKSDALWLRKAAIFQAAWLLEQPDALSRTNVSSLSQDGVSMSASDGLTFVLAPLAKRALNNCSWTKSGTTMVAPSKVSTVVDPVVSDDHEWKPL